MGAGILVWGAGAVGGTVGAYLARAGHGITFVDVDTDHVEAIRTGGLRISGPVDTFGVRATAFTPEQVAGTWSRIFLAVKAQHTRDAAAALRPHLAADGYVLSLQNGLCELDVAAEVGRERTVGAFINFGADWLGPGEVMRGNRAAVVVGELDGRKTPRLAALLQTMRDFEPDAIATDRIFAFLWGKLAYAALLFAQALGHLSIADCLARPELLPLWRRLGGEAVGVALAEGVAPLGFNGFDPDAFRSEASAAAAAASVAAMVVFNRGSAKSHSGIWRDLAVRKRPTEVDFQLGPVIAAGSRHGLECPTLQRLVAMIHEVEQGRRALDDRNLNELLKDGRL